MRSLIAPLILMATLSACAAHSAPEGVPYRSDLPLEARIQASATGGVNGFYVNRPAYVAIFEIVPGGGASLLYPYNGGGMSSGFVYGGMRHLPSHGYGFRSAGTYLGGRQGGLQSGPRYIYMLASEEPFDVNDFRSFAFNMRNTMGLRFASFSARSTMEDLTRALVPDLRRTNWTSDVYVYWPNTLYDRRMPADDYVVINCNGRQYYVHRGNIRQVERVCNDGSNPPVRIDTTAVDPETGVPTRVRPTPKRATDRPGSIWADEIPQRVGEPSPRIDRRERIVKERERMRPEPRRVEPPAPRPQPRAQPPRPVTRTPSRAIPASRPRPGPVEPTRPPTKRGGGGGGEVR